MKPVSYLLLAKQYAYNQNEQGSQVMVECDLLSKFLLLAKLIWQLQGQAGSFETSELDF